MKLLFKQRLFSWFDSYDIYDENGSTVYTVKGQFSWGHKLHILDANENHIATVQQVILTFMPRFDLYIGENQVGQISREFTLFHPKYNIDCNGWQVDGSFMEWDYSITFGNQTIATITKELFNFTDTYVIDVANPSDALMALMVVLAIDAEKCSRNNS